MASSGSEGLFQTEVITVWSLVFSDESDVAKFVAPGIIEPAKLVAGAASTAAGSARTKARTILPYLGFLDEPRRYNCTMVPYMYMCT